MADPEQRGDAQPSPEAAALRLHKILVGLPSFEPCRGPVENWPEGIRRRRFPVWDLWPRGWREAPPQNVKKTWSAYGRGFLVMWVPDGRNPWGCRVAGTESNDPERLAAVTRVLGARAACVPEEPIRRILVEAWRATAFSVAGKDDEPEVFVRNDWHERRLLIEQVRPRVLELVDLALRAIRRVDGNVHALDAVKKDDLLHDETRDSAIAALRRVPGVGVPLAPASVVETTPPTAQEAAVAPGPPESRSEPGNPGVNPLDPGSATTDIADRPDRRPAAPVNWADALPPKSGYRQSLLERWDNARTWALGGGLKGTAESSRSRLFEMTSRLLDQAERDGKRCPALLAVKVVLGKLFEVRQWVDGPTYRMRSICRVCGALHRRSDGRCSADPNGCDGQIEQLAEDGYVVEARFASKRLLQRLAELLPVAHEEVRLLCGEPSQQAAARGEAPEPTSHAAADQPEEAGVGSLREPLGCAVEQASPTRAVVREGGTSVFVTGPRRVWLLMKVVNAGRSLTWNELVEADIHVAADVMDRRIRSRSASGTATPKNALGSSPRGDRTPKMATQAATLQNLGNRIRHDLGKLSYHWDQDGQGVVWSSNCQ